MRIAGFVKYRGQQSLAFMNLKEINQITPKVFARNDGNVRILLLFVLQ